MPIKICPDCGGIVSESRNECIHCGHLFVTKQKKNIALLCLWISLAWTIIAYLINMVISLRVGGTLKWMFEYIKYGYIASLVFLCKAKQPKSKIKTSKIISLILMVIVLFVTVAPAVFYNPFTYTKYDDNSYYVRHFGKKYSGDVKIPSNYKGLPVVRIGDYAFAHCTNITNIEIEEGVTVISNFCGFYGCTSLESVVIPASTVCIGSCAFTGCTNLKAVYYKGTEESWNEITIVPDHTEILAATRYYYSESQPAEEGNYWYYDNYGRIAIW